MSNNNFILKGTKCGSMLVLCSLFPMQLLYAQKKNSDSTTKEKKIEEVVMIGYGSVKKSDLTGSVSSVKGSDLAKVPVSNIAEALTGKIAGVNITSSEGSPDADINIRIRGGGSISQDSSPLLIVDGFPVSSISDISPSDIENITILKDASSTAIYGSRGSNGVILVTTKSGKNGKLSVSFNSSLGFKQIAKMIDVLSPYDFAKWQYEFAMLKSDLPSYENYFGSYSTIEKYRGYTGKNWQKEIYGRTGTVSNNDISIRGGSEKVNYSLNFARYDEKSIMIGSDFKRDNISLNLKSSPNKKIDLAMTVRYSNTKISGGGANEQKEVSSQDSRLRTAVAYSPIDLPGLTTESTDDADVGYLVHPLTAIKDNDRKQERRNYNILGSFGWKVVKNLQFRSDIGIDYSRNLDYRFYGRSTYYVHNIPPVLLQGLSSLIMGSKEDQRFRNANTLNYDFKDYIGENHDLKLMLGEEMIISKSNVVTSTIQGFPKSFTFENSMNLTSQGVPQSVINYYYPDDKLLSFFGRLNYGYKDKYLFTATMRADGSSKFLGNNKWGYFPSAAVAWKMNQENFLKDVSWLNLLKLRVSYGKSGNNNIPTGQTIQEFQSSVTAWINNVTNYFAASSVLVNPELKWETTTTQNLGLDYEIFKRRLTGSFEIYKNVTNDVLNQFMIPGSGYTFQYRNIGDIQNTGYEASLNYDIIKKKEYNLSFSFNIGVNKNKITSLGIMNDYEYTTNWTSSTGVGTDYAVHVGQPVGVMYGYVSDGRYEVTDFNYAAGTYTLKSGVVDNSSIVGAVKPGNMKLKDINGDGKIDANDKTIIGNANPKNTGGFNLNGNFRNFDLSAAFNWSYGNNIYNANKIEYTTATTSSPDGQYRNLSTVMQDGTRWTNIDASGQVVTDPTALAALNASTTLWSPYMARYVLTDWAIENGSFLRLNTLSLGYSFPESLTSKLKLSKLRIYATAYNVFVITNYSGPDPEVSTIRDTPLTAGVDSSAYPKSRQYIFGINLNF